MSGLNNNSTSYAFVFVCQQGDLEGLSLLLAASLKRFLDCNYEMIAAVPLPEEKWGKLAPKTMTTFQQMGVRIEYFENPISRDKKGNPLTNKIYSLQIPTQMDKLIFLDSDLLCLQDFDPIGKFMSPFSAAPTFKATGKNWDKIYQAVSSEVPSTRIKTLFSEELQPPYFNSGLIAVDAKLASELTGMWLDSFDKIDRSGAMDSNLYFREQVSLAVAVMRLQYQYDLLGEKYNYWVKYQPLDSNDLPYFLHHTWPHPPIYHQPYLKQLVRSLVDDYPAIEPFVQRCRWKYYLRPEWMVKINQWAHQNRHSMKKRWGSDITNWMIHGHS
ncbi:MAG: hypothetical protein F6K00_07290 [Leptolyngbya sp. SIOISBB]|nr:hypothetical protein [Leptolyngbya sp. SIOISBB]